MLLVRGLERGFVVLQITDFDAVKLLPDLEDFNERRNRRLGKGRGWIVV